MACSSMSESITGNCEWGRLALFSFMFRVRVSIATVLVVLIAVACGNPPGAEIEVSTDVAETTVSIALDSEWQVPSGFNVSLPMTNERLGTMLRNDAGAPPDLPEFTMLREGTPDQELETVVIAVYSDGVVADRSLSEMLDSWLNSFRDAKFGETVEGRRNGVQWAMSRGTAQGPGQLSPQGLIVIVITEPETQMAWRLSCLVSSEEVSDAVAGLCEQVRDGFSPQSMSAMAP